MRRRMTILVAIIGLTLVGFGCDEERKSKPASGSSSSSSSSSGGGEATGNPAGSDETGNESGGGGSASGSSGGANVGSVDDWNANAQNYPTGLDSAPLKGSTTPHDSPAGTSRRPSNNWATGGGPGSFILAGSSRPRTAGGDVIRRIDMKGGQPVEHDFNPALEGTQGLALLVPEKLRGDWERSDFSGDGLFQGKMCGFVPGPDKKIIAFAGKGAFIIDPYAEGEGGAVTPEAAIVFPRGRQVCDGLYSPQWQKVYAFEVTRVNASTGKSGVYVANVPPSGVVSNAGLFLIPKNYGIVKTSRNTFQDGDIFQNVLYMLEGEGHAPGGKDVVLHRVPLNDQGEPLFEHAKQVATGNPITRMQGCSSSNPDNTPGALAVEVGGMPVLLTGGSRGVAAFDISTDALNKLDMDPRAGLQPLDLSDEYGRGAPEIQVSPDGNEVIVMPFCRANGKVKVQDTRPIATGDHFARRLAVLDIADGELGNGTEMVDVGYHWFQKKLAKEAQSRQMRLPNFTMSFRDMAVSPSHIVVIGYGGRGNSGLGSGGDIIIADRSTGKVMVFGEPAGKKAHEQYYGFRLAKGDPDINGQPQSVHAALWIP